MVMMLLGLSCVMLQYDVMCAQIEWGSNTDLVNEFNPIQRRENYKLMVAMVGDKIKLVCDVAFASKPVKTIVWEIDGKHQNRERTQKEEEDLSSGKVFINDTFEIEINENEDDKRVSCVYDEESVEAILHVFKLEIKKDKEVCDTCVGDVELLFRESLRSKTGENNVDERIKYKIQNITKLTPNDKNSNSAYSVTIPIATASKMNQDLKLCCPRPPEITNNVDEKMGEYSQIPWMYIIGIGGGGVFVVVVVVLVMMLVIPLMTDWKRFKFNN